MESFCDHYQRKCLLLSPCCGKEYRCRLCHDDNENHSLDRKSVKSIVCSQCNKKQTVGRNCEDCGILFGNYSCIECRLFDDTDKQQFHCDGCGICRVGGRENFFHCDVCNICISTAIRDSHKCLIDASKTNCPVCLEFIHTSRRKIHIPNCSHLMHWDCYKGMMEHGNYTCPVCNKCLEDMSNHWKLLDKMVSETPMPEIYRDYKVNILCRDCQEKSQDNFHVVGLKCQHCGSYNTTRIGGDAPIPTDPLNTLQDLVQELDDRETEEDEEESWETVSEGEAEALPDLANDSMEENNDNTQQGNNFTEQQNDTTEHGNDTTEQKEEEDEQSRRNAEEMRSGNCSLD